MCRALAGPFQLYVQANVEIEVLRGLVAEEKSMDNLD
jgi:hypothetical protein